MFSYLTYQVAASHFQLRKKSAKKTSKKTNVNTNVPGASNPLWDLAGGASGDIVNCISFGPVSRGPKNTDDTTITIQIMTEIKARL
ncbi:MAG TPA: hypothetical protein PLU58_07735, partial [Saprospiraceae bacterium]|nr:hypothetical protein [Saprospiraceae bacterium]